VEEMIRTVHLTKRYGDKTIVDNVSLSVNKGEIYGFLGLNGAGKTTMIRALLGMIRPTFGDVYLYGKRLADGGQGLWKRVGYMVRTKGRLTK
jgi:ABC-2 type transport system ATP-binding protein